MMNMGMSQKIKAQLHVIVGPQHISIAFETDEGAQSQWSILVGMLAKKKPGDFITMSHEMGAVWIDLASIDGATWTKEQRVTVPTGQMSPGLRMS